MKSLWFVLIAWSMLFAECKLSAPRWFAASFPHEGATMDDFFECVRDDRRCLTIEIEDGVCKYYESMNYIGRFENVFSPFFAYLKTFPFYKERKGVRAYIHSNSGVFALTYWLDMIDVDTYDFLPPLSRDMSCLIYGAFECVDSYVDPYKMLLLERCSGMER